MKQRLLVGGVIASLVVWVCACQDGEALETGASRSSKVEDTQQTRVAEPSSPSSGAHAAKDATLRVHLVDAPAEEVTAVVVSIEKVEANIGGEWLTVSDAARTVDLLTLQDGAFLDLGSAKLPAGYVEQMRLRLAPGGDHHVVTADGESHALEIPSGEESGIKLGPGFDLAPCSITELTIDFDGKESVSVGANKQGWRLRPVVTIKALESTGTCESAAATSDDAGADAGED